MNVYFLTILLSQSLIHSFFIKDIESGKYVKATERGTTGETLIRNATSFEEADSKLGKGELNILEANTKRALDYPGTGKRLNLWHLHDQPNQRFVFKLDEKNRLQMVSSNGKHLYYDRNTNAFLGDSYSDKTTGIELVYADGTAYISHNVPRAEEEPKHNAEQAQVEGNEKEHLDSEIIKSVEEKLFKFQDCNKSVKDLRDHLFKKCNNGTTSINNLGLSPESADILNDIKKNDKDSIFDCSKDDRNSLHVRRFGQKEIRDALEFVESILKQNSCIKPIKDAFDLFYNVLTEH